MALVVGVLRILKGWPMHRLIIAGYLVVIALTAVGIAFGALLQMRATRRLKEVS